jgi:hypothetical protein
MKKIPTLFVRDYSQGGFVIPEVNPVAEWVMEDAYPAHRKYDGVCMGLFPTVKGEIRIEKGIGSGEIDVPEDIDAIWMARREVKQGWEFPEDFVIEQFDSQTKKTFGWVPAEQSPFYKYFLDALDDLQDRYFGTYELCGPKVNGNPEGFKAHKLVNHEQTELISNVHVLDFHEMSVEDAYVALKETLGYMPIEGVVWRSVKHGMVKLKKKDFQYE